MDRDRDPLVQPGLRNRPQQMAAAAADEASKLAAPVGPARLFPPQVGPPQPPPTAGSLAPPAVPIIAPGQPPLQPPPQQQRGRRLEESPDVRRARVRRVCLGALKEIAKTVVLVTCLTIYAILGALAFGALEQTNERDTCSASQRLYLQMEADTTAALWNVATNYQKSEYSAAQYDVIEKMVKNFTGNVLNIGYTGTNCALLGKPGGVPYAWNFPGALLFSVTIFTTVGYGNITPKTNWGRMFCIAYAMIGLPLMFFTLANIGEHMAVVFRFVYIKVCCLGLCARRRQAANKKPPTDQQKQAPWKNNYNDATDDDDDDDEDDDEDEVTIPLTVTLLVIAGYIGLGALVFAVWEGWNAMAAAYFTFVTISTIGLGDLVPGFNNVGGDAQGSLKLLTCAAYMLFGMSLLSMGFDLIQYEMANKMTAIGGQNVGRAGDTVNELQGRDEDEADGIVIPARNLHPTAARKAPPPPPPPQQQKPGPETAN